MTAKRLAIWVGGAAFIWLIVAMLLRGSDGTSNVPVPTAWPESSRGTTESVAASDQKNVALPQNPTLLYWAYNPTRKILLAYHPELNQLQAVSAVTGAVTNTVPLVSDALLDAKLSPSGERVLVKGLNAVGTAGFSESLLSESTSATLPYTVQGMDWLPNDEVIYIYNDAKTITLSRAKDIRLTNWQSIIPLDKKYAGGTVSAAPDGKYALVIAPKDAGGDVLVVDLTSRTTWVAARNITFGRWASSGHTALLQQRDTSTTNLVIVQPDSQTASAIPNSTIPSTDLISNDTLIGLSAATDDTPSLSALVINTATGLSQQQGVTITLAGQPTLLYVDPNEQRVLVGDETQLISFGYAEIISKLTSP